MNNQTITKIIGIAFLVLGVGLLYWGFQESQSVVSEISESITGSYTDNTMMRFIGGAASLAIGLFLLYRR